MGGERKTHVDWHYDKCCEAWCALWESKRRITNTQERGVADMVRSRVNRRIKKEYKKEYAEKGLNEEAAIERAGNEYWGKPAVNRCRAELLGEVGKGSKQKSRTPAPEYKNRVAVVKGCAARQSDKDDDSASLELERTSNADKQRSFLRGMGIEIPEGDIVVAGSSILARLVAESVEAGVHNALRKYVVVAEKRAAEGGE
jgi:hypothetical protein